MNVLDHGYRRDASHSGNRQFWLTLLESLQGLLRYVGCYIGLFRDYIKVI